MIPSLDGRSDLREVKAATVPLAKRRRRFGTAKPRQEPSPSRSFLSPTTERARIGGRRPTPAASHL